MARIAPLNAKGTRDYLPRDLVHRNRVFGILRETFERYGYEPLETPAIERSDVLTGKYGEEEKLLFYVLKRGRELESSARRLTGIAAGQERDQESSTSESSAGELSRIFADEALRYDLTVPLTRVVAAHQNDLVFPFRRYQMQPVWRAERPQHGRYREFYQCDVDCVGSRSMTVDAEMAAVHHEVFSRLGFTTFVTRINHRGVLDALMEGCGVAPELRVSALTAVDKLDKIGTDGVHSELVKVGLPAGSVDRLMEAIGISGAPQAVVEALKPLLGASENGATGLRELDQVFAYLQMMGVPAERYTFDLSLVRALSYYTGTIYETVLTDSKLGSLGGGGRYDRLIGQFTGRDMPCVGISFGIERIFDAIAEKGLEPAVAEATTVQALVTLFAPETLAPSFAVASELRNAGIRTEVYAEPKELRAQLTFANRKGIPLAVILGPDELARGAVVIRDLRSGVQRDVPRTEAVAQAQAMLAGE